MPILGQLLLLLPLLVICSFFPGFYLIRRLQWTPLEKLCGAIGLSLILVYLAVWAIYCFGPLEQRPAYGCVIAAAIVLTALSWPDAEVLFGSFRIRQTLGGFAFLLVGTILMLSMIRVYSGATWAADWYEHFQRSLFFLDRFAPSTKFIDVYDLPSRPPMQNVLAGFFLGLTSEDFSVFQVIFACLNTLIFLPCVLLLPALGVNKRRSVLPLVFLFAATPVVMQNTTYTWTKALAAFYVILAISLYLAGWRKRDWTRTAGAFVALAAGTLVHYSAGPYLVVLGLHFLVRACRRGLWLEFATATLLAALLLATWFGWSVHVYGTKTTLASNTSITSASPGKMQNLAKIGANVFDTVVPVWLRGGMPAARQPNRYGALRDQAFVFYQLNLIFAMGAIGGPLIVWLVYRLLVRGQRTSERLFWRVIVPVCVVLGVAVVGERDELGVPHLTLLALEAAGITLLAAAFPKLSGLMRLVVMVGCCIDLSFGVFLQARIESLENTGEEAVFPEMTYRVGGRFDLAAPTSHSLSRQAWRNWQMKHRAGLHEKWLRELPRGHEADPEFQAAWKEFEIGVKRGLQDEEVNWQGWAKRHGGQAQYLGDLVAGSSGRGTDIASVAFLLMYGACLGLMVRHFLHGIPTERGRLSARAALG